MDDYQVNIIKPEGFHLHAAVVSNPTIDGINIKGSVDIDHHRVLKNTNKENSRQMSVEYGSVDFNRITNN